jgi:hypothetical protein
VGLKLCKLQRQCQGMLCFEAGDGFDVLVQVHVESAEVPIRPALPRPVAHLLCNRQVLRVVLERLAEVLLRLIPDAEVRVRPALPARSPSLVSIFNTRIWSAVGFAAVRVSARAAAKHSPLCPALHALVWRQQRERVRVGEGERR